MMKGVNFQFNATNKAAPAMRSFENGLRGVKSQMNSVNTANQSFMRGMNDNRRAVQQVGFQVADFSVQLAGGQNAILAFAQQGGQILQFFGAFGAVAGAALAVFGAWAIATGAFTSDTEKLADAMKPLNKDFTDYETYVKRSAQTTAELRGEFGNFANEVKGFSAFMAGVKLSTTMEDLKLAIVPLKGQLSGVRTAFDELTAAQKAYDLAIKSGATTNETYAYNAKNEIGDLTGQLVYSARLLGLNSDQAIKLETALTQIGAANSMGEMATYAADALVVMQEISATGVYLPGPLREAAAALDEIVRRGASAATAAQTIKIGFDEMAIAAGNVVDNVRLIGSSADGAIGAVQRLGVAMWNAAMVPVNAQKQLAQMKLEFSPGGQALTAFGGRGGNSAQNALGQKYDMFGRPIDKSKKTGGGGGGKQDALAELQKQLELETAILGKTEAQQRIIRALGPDWKAYGDVAITGLTAQIAAIDAFNQKMAEQQSIADVMKSSMEDAFMGVVSGTMKAKDAFKSMAASIISELFRVLVVQRLVGSFSSATGTGSGIVGFFGKALSSFAGGGYTGYGARSGGVDGKGGFPAILHPNETVVDHTMGDGAGVTVNQTISFGSGVTRAEVQSMIPKIVEATKSAVLDARKRGGAYGSAFG
jgi:hypothetical protein